MKPYFFLFLVSTAALILSACSVTGAATGAAASIGIAAAQEGGLKRAAGDLRIQTQINDLWLKYDLDTFAKLDLTVNQGRVLVTGVVQDPEKRVEAIRLAWQPDGVKQVINEIKVADSDGVIGFARDSWISARLRTALTLDKDVQSINYSIDTVQGTIYLMGVAQNQAELNRVVEKARTIPDVRRVVSYVKLAGDLKKGVQRSTQSPARQPDNNPTPAKTPDTQSYPDGFPRDTVTSRREPSSYPDSYDYVEPSSGDQPAWIRRAQEQPNTQPPRTAPGHNQDYDDGRPIPLTPQDVDSRPLY